MIPKFYNLTDGPEDTIDVSIFGFIDPGWMMEGDTSSAEIAALYKARPQAKKIRQTINSAGGDAFGGVALYNLALSHGAEVESVIVGQAGSAASIAAMAGRTVMMRGSMLMVHNPWTVVAGDAEELRAAADTLDAVRDSLVSIYQRKTGKSAAELRKILSAETWMTATEAKAAGFADEIRDGAVTAKAEGESVILNSVAFPRAACAPQILAMATAPPPAVEAPAPAPRAMTRATLAAEAPDLLAALIAEGAATERARIQAIDEIAAHVPAELVAAAKYGATPGTAETLAVAALRARPAVPTGAALLAARARDTAPLAAVVPIAPRNNVRDEEIAAAKQIAAAANRPRGGR